MAGVFFYLKEGLPVCDDLLVVLVDQSCLFLQIHTVVVGQVKDLGLSSYLVLILDKKVIIFVIVQLLDHIVDEEHIFESMKKVLVLVPIEVGQDLVHDDLSLAVEDALTLLLLVGPFIG